MPSDAPSGLQLHGKPLGDLLSDDQLGPEQGELLDDPLARSRAQPAVDPARVVTGPKLGVRPNRPLDRIVTLFVHARPGNVMRGPDVVVAAEKVGLVYGDMGIYHRLASQACHDDPVYKQQAGGFTKKAGDA